MSDAFRSCQSHHHIAPPSFLIPPSRSLFTPSSSSHEGACISSLTFKVDVQVPSADDQIFTVLSYDPDTMLLPSGLKATEETP